MIELISLIILFLGLVYASYYDLKTTEIPDLFAYIFLALALFLFFFYGYLNNFNNFLNNFFISLTISLIGFLMYFFGQWGLGDSFLLAASSFYLFFKIPKSFLIYSQLDFFTNVIIVGAFYIPIYMLPKFLRDKKAKNFFILSVKKNFVKNIFLIIITLIVFLSISFLFFNQFLIKPAIFILTFSLFLTLLLFYLKSCEKILIKKILVKNLKPGDVLLESKRWDGIDKECIERIKRSGKKYVYIKNGVAFSPVFLISLVITLLYGNLYFHILRIFFFLL
ncbi:MAG: prepilin peptidase [Candidatus Aenigmatarchaeota archaeon]